MLAPPCFNQCFTLLFYFSFLVSILSYVNVTTLICIFRFDSYIYYCVKYLSFFVILYFSLPWTLTFFYDFSFLFILLMLGDVCLP